MLGKRIGKVRRPEWVPRGKLNSLASWRSVAGVRGTIGSSSVTTTVDAEKNLLIFRRDADEDGTDRDSKISVLTDEKPEEEMFLEHVIFLPFSVQWQVWVILVVTGMYIFYVYTAVFTRCYFKEVLVLDAYQSVYSYSLYAAEAFYWCDAILLAVHKFWKKMRYTQPYREHSVFHIFVYLVSLPSAANFVFNGGNANSATVDVLKYLSILRLLRVFKIFSDAISSVHFSVPLLLVILTEFLVVVYTIFAVLFYTAIWNVQDTEGLTSDLLLLRILDTLNGTQSNKGWPIKTSLDTFLISIFVMGNSFQSRGQLVLQTKTITMGFVIQLYMLTSVFMNMAIIGLFTSIMIHNEECNVAFSARKEHLDQKLKQMNCDADLHERSMKWYTVLWEKREGVLKSLTEKSLLPVGLYRDTKLDVYWPAFKHSHLFREKDICFLTSVSTQMRTNFHCKGDVLYKRGIIKDSFIYILSGIVQVLSTYDSSTPIVTFYPGTCIGEGSLFVRYPCNVMIICATYCEIQVLRDVDYSKLVKKFPAQCRSMRREIIERWEHAKLLFAIKSIKNSCDVYDRIGMHRDGSLKRIKRMAREIDREVFKKESTHYYDEEEDRLMKISNIVTQKPEYIGASSDYLDMVVISEDTQLINDEITFLSTEFPMIYHPNSPFIKMWEAMVLILVSFFLIYIPFQTIISSEISESDMVVSITIQLLLFVDLFMQCMVAVTTQEGVLIRMDDIFLYRLSSPTFMADLLGSVPINWIIYCGEDIGPVGFGILRTNYLLRGWRIMRFLKSLINETFRYRTEFYLLFCMTVFTYSVLYFTMVYSIISCPNLVCDPNGMWSQMLHLGNPNRTHFLKRIVRPVLMTTILALGTGGSRYVPLLRSENMCTLAMDVFGFVLNAYFLAGLCTVITLAIVTTEQSKEKMILVLHFIKRYKFTPELQKRVNDELKLLNVSLNPRHPFKGDPDLVGLSLELRQEIKLENLAEFLVKVPLFSSTDKKYIAAVAGITRYHLSPENGLLLNSGVYARNMYVIVRGYCDLVNVLTGEVEGTKGPGFCFGALELLLNIPTAQTVRAKTCVVYLGINGTDLSNVLHEFPQYRNEIHLTIEKCRQLLNLPVIDGHFATLPDEAVDMESFTCFGYNMSVGSKAEVEYMQPFRNAFGSGVFSGFVSYVLLRTTFLPCGRAIWITEVARSCLALVSSFVFPARNILVYGSKYFSYMFYLLDMTAYADLYIRLHIGYYNTEGILVTHPLKTASNYLSKGFVIDLLACFPFDILLSHLLTHANDILYYNRIIQVVRLFGLLNFIQSSGIDPRRIWPILLKNLILVSVIVNMLGSIWLSVNCRVMPGYREKFENYTVEGIKCTGLQWKSDVMGNHVSPGRAYLVAEFYICMIFTQMDIVGFAESWDPDGYVTLATTYVGYAYCLIITGKIGAMTYLCNVSHRYQQKVKTLLRFLDKSHVSKELKDEFRQYYNTVWKQHYGQNPKEIARFFDGIILQGDILYHMYGEHLKEFTIFKRSTYYFFRSLLLEFHPKMYHKGAFVLTEGYIHKSVYLLTEGYITVMFGKRPSVTLGKGTFFGNLDQTLVCQQPVSILATTHVEILVMRSKKFYDILEVFPRYKSLFLEAYTLALEKGLSVIPGEIEGSCEDITQERRSSIGKKNFLISIYFELTKQVLSTLSVLVTLYSMSICDISPIILFSIYTIDYLKLVTIVINCYQPYANDVGIYIMDKRSIRLNYLRNKSGFVLDFVSIIPFESLWFAFNDSRSAYLWLRINRILNYINIWQFTKTYCDKITNTHVSIRLMSLFIKSYFFIVFLAFIRLSLFNYCSKTWNVRFYDKVLMFLQSTNSMMANFARFPTKLNVEYWNNSMIIFKCIQMAIMVIIMASVLGHIIFYIELHFYALLSYIQERRAILKLLRIQMVSKYLYECVGSYLRYLWDYNSGCHLPEIVYEAPDSLQSKLMATLFGHHLQNHSIFSVVCFREDFMNQLMLFLRPEFLLPGNVIVRCGTVDNTMYFVHKGEVRAYKHDGCGNDIPIAILPHNEYFGTEQGLRHTVPHAYTYKSYTMVQLIKLKFTDWSYLLDYYPIVKRKIYKQLAKNRATREYNF